jgi:OmpR-family two-component system manganese-sensing response regulator
VEIIADGQQAMVALKLHSYDLIVLDWQLPGSSGPEICRKFRQQGGHTPILMITAKSTIADKEFGFEGGVDDYLTKPFHLKELSVRVKALLRRPDVFVGELRAGSLSLEVESFRAYKSGQEIKLMPKEFALLEFLIRNKGKVFTAQELLDRVWESLPESGTEALRQCMKRLREKIDSNGQPSLIENIPHKGYTIRSEN